MSVPRPRRTGLFAYEHRSEPLAPAHVLRGRLARMIGINVVVLVCSLALGVAGYHWIVGVPRLVDCVYSAAMIMGGMGPVGDPVTNDAGKWFASFYALYSGVGLLAGVGLLLAPVLHRIMHRLHLESGDERD